MTDQESWDFAIAAVTGEYALLSSEQKALLAALAEKLQSCKDALHAIVAQVAADDVCRACGGECCRSGKYHVTVVDILVYLVEGRALFAPRFNSDSCPFLGEQGCLMAPANRPFICVTFNCERLESLLPPAEKELLAQLEGDLRTFYRRFEKLFDNRFTGGLLINYERDLLRDRLPILRGKG